MKHFKQFFVFALLALFSVGAWGGEVTISPSQALNDGGVDPIIVTCAKGDGTSAPAISSGQLRLYQAGSGKTTGNTITFSSTYPITKIVFDFITGKTASNGSFSDGSYDDATMTWTGSVTSLTLTVTGTTSGTRIYINGMTVTYEAGGSTKTLSSIAVSGNPTKTAYYVGDEFDPTGLVVTGTYSDDTHAPIASGITWSYDPSQTLALNQTSIGVTAIVSEISSPKYNVTGLTVTEAPAAVNYEKVTAEPTDWSGEYLLVYEDGSDAYVWNGADAVNCYVAATISNDVIAKPEGAATLTIAEDGTGYSLLINGGANDGKYITDNANNAALKFADAAYAATLSYETTWTKILFSQRCIRFNNASNQLRFRYYADNGQQPVQLYKKVGGSVKPAAGLAFETSAYLVKANGSLATPTLSTADGFDGTVTYASSDADVVAVNITTGALTIKAAGKAEITASSLETENFKAGSAKYTVYVAEQAGTAEDPLTEASAKALIDLGCTLNAHVNGIVLSQNSTNFTVTLTDGFQFYKAKDLNNVAFESAYLGAGDEVTAVGALKKFSSTYELDEGCYLTFYEQASTPLTSIANDEASAYTVAQALEFAANPTTYDLSDIVYVRGKVAIASTALFSNKYLTYSISDDGTTTSVLKVYNGLGIDGAAFTSKDDILVGDVVVVKGNLTQFNTELEFAANNELVSKKPVATIAIDNMELEYAEVATISATITPAAAASTVEYSIKAGSDDVITLSGDQITAKSVTGTATIVATIAGTDDYEGATKEFTVSVAEADTRKVANSPAEFTTTSGDLDPADIAFEAFKGGAANDPYLTNGAIRLYQISSTNAFGGFITLKAAKGCTIDQVKITTTEAYATTVAYSVDGNENLLGSESVAKSSDYSTPSGLNVESVNIVNKGTGSNGRLEIASIKVWYTGDPLSVDHYELGGTYATEFEVGDEFNHDGLIVYAAYDAQGDDKEDITAECTFSTPDMSAEGEQTIEITYKEAVVKSYTITISASTDTRKIADSPAEFEAVSGNMVPADIAFEAFKGGAANDPYLTNGAIRLYQISSTNAFGGFITLKAAKGCTIDQVKITTTEAYATTVAYSVDGNENLLGSESVAKSSDYSTPSGLNVESVNIVNKGTGSSGRLEIASIKVWYTGSPLAIDHYFLGGTYETTFEQNGTFDYTGLEVYASYDAGETITEQVEGFTVEADLSTAGSAEAIVKLNDVELIRYDITVTAGKEDPALAYSPVSETITAGDAWSAPTLSNTFNVTPITYSSDKESVATVDENGVITLAGGYGTAVITAHFDETAAYIESEATYTITVNKPAATPTSTIYRKVTATGDITDGEYLIVYEGDATHDAVAFDGSLDDVDQALKALPVAIVSDEIAGNTDLDAATFTIDVTSGTLQSASGWYIGRTANSNGLDKSESEAYVNTFAITDGAAVITSSAGPTLRYNYASDQLRFRYYKSGQQAIQLYKKVTPTKEVIRGDLSAGKWGTICPKQTVENVEGASFYQITYLEEQGGLPFNVVFDEIGSTTLTAGQPYFFIAEGEEIKGNPTGAELTEAGAGVNGFYGYIGASPLALPNIHAEYTPGEDNTFVIYNNSVFRIKSATDLKSERCYININATEPTRTPSSASPVRRRIVMGVQNTNAATGMDELNTSEAPRKMIIDGKMYIFRGEKMYNANGILVK